MVSPTKTSDAVRATASKSVDVEEVLFPVAETKATAGKSTLGPAKSAVVETSPKANGSKTASRPLTTADVGKEVLVAQPVQPVRPSRLSQGTLSRQELRQRQRLAMQRRRTMMSGLIIFLGLAGLVALVFAALAQGGAFSTPAAKPKVLTITSDYPNQRFSAKGIKASAVQKTADGLQILDLKVGTGAALKATDTLTANYTGWLTDGTVFDSSTLATIPQPHVQPAQFQLSQVVQGWQEGLVGMKVGGVRRLYIPAALAYGDNPPQGSVITAGATLVFEVELISIP